MQQQDYSRSIIIKRLSNENDDNIDVDNNSSTNNDMHNNNDRIIDEQTNTASIDKINAENTDFFLLSFRIEIIMSNDEQSYVENFRCHAVYFCFFLLYRFPLFFSSPLT